MTRATETTVRLPTPPGFDLDRAVRGHGWYDLPPFAYDRERGSLALTFDAGHAVVDAVVTRNGRGLSAVVSSTAAVDADAVRRAIAGVLRLGEDLGPARRALAAAPELLACLDAGGGRLLCAPSVFEDVVKMICTTNCSWSLTRVMVAALVGRAGRRGPSGRRAFPTAGILTRKSERWFRDVVRAGYRAPYLRELAHRVASGELDLESMRAPGVDAALAYDSLRGIKGVGPYAADNLLRLLGRHDRLGLDSWCRGKYRRMHPRTPKQGLDAAIERRYRRFAPYQGLALWLDLTRDWFDGAEPLWP